LYPKLFCQCDLKRKLFRIISVYLDLIYRNRYLILCTFRVLEKIDIIWEIASDVYRLQKRI